MFVICTGSIVTVMLLSVTRTDNAVSMTYVGVVTRSTVSCAALSQRTRPPKVVAEAGCCICSVPDAFCHPLRYDRYAAVYNIWAYSN